MHECQKSETAQDWEDRYLANSTRWERGQINPALHEWLASDKLQQHRRILVPGCGRAPEPLYLAQKGFSVTGLDFAPTAINHQQAMLDQNKDKLDIKFLQADILEWSPETRFDAIYDQTCLCALNPTVWSEYERQLRKWLQPGGNLFALFMQTGKQDGPPFDCSLPQMRKLFKEKHWHWPHEAPVRSDHNNLKVELGVSLTLRQVQS